MSEDTTSKVGPVSRRNFLKLMGGSAIALATGVEIAKWVGKEKGKGFENAENLNSLNKFLELFDKPKPEEYLNNLNEIIKFIAKDKLPPNITGIYFDISLLDSSESTYTAMWVRLDKFNGFQEYSSPNSPSQDPDKFLAILQTEKEKSQKLAYINYNIEFTPVDLKSGQFPWLSPKPKDKVACKHTQSYRVDFNYQQSLSDTGFSVTTFEDYYTLGYEAGEGRVFSDLISKYDKNINRINTKRNYTAEGDSPSLGPTFDPRIKPFEIYVQIADVYNAAKAEGK